MSAIAKTAPGLFTTLQSKITPKNKWLGKNSKNTKNTVNSVIHGRNVDTTIESAKDLVRK